MAYGIGEDPARSIAPNLQGLDYPLDRDEIVEAAEDNEAPVAVINLLKSLPRERYDSQEMVMRDLAEAARRFGSGGHAPFEGTLDRRNLGRDAVEHNVDGNTRHP